MPCRTTAAEFAWSRGVKLIARTGQEMCIIHPSSMADLDNSMRPAFLARAAIRAGVAAEAGVAAKDLRHEGAVHAAGGDFFPWW